MNHRRNYFLSCLPFGHFLGMLSKGVKLFLFKLRRVSAKELHSKSAFWMKKANSAQTILKKCSLFAYQPCFFHWKHCVKSGWVISRSTATYLHVNSQSWVNLFTPNWIVKTLTLYFSLSEIISHLISCGMTLFRLVVLEFQTNMTILYSESEDHGMKKSL